MKTKYYEVKENPMFPPEVSMLTRFMRPERALKCTICGKKRKRLWTMLVPFKGHTMHQFTTTPSDELEALSPVCEDHPIAPVFIELAKSLNNTEKGGG